MNRRQLGAFLGLAVAMPQGLAAAESDTVDICSYLGTRNGIFDMLLFAFDDVAPSSDNDIQLAFGLYRISAIARAGYESLVILTPSPDTKSNKRNHELLLEALSTVADVEGEIMASLASSSYEDAIVIGADAAIRAFDLLEKITGQNSTEEVPTQFSPCSTKTPVPSRTSTSGVTMANFNRLHEGMSYNEVVSILGSRGELVSSTTLAGITTEMYMWEGDSLGANMNAMFQDGKLISKAQFGLD